MSTKQLQFQLRILFQRLLHMRVALFIIFLVALYVGIAWRVNVLAQATPDQIQIDSQTKASKNPHIDKALIEKIKRLQDNSVNVKSLFDQARQNPFKE